MLPLSTSKISPMQKILCSHFSKFAVCEFECQVHPKRDPNFYSLGEQLLFTQMTVDTDKCSHNLLDFFFYYTLRRSRCFVGLILAYCYGFHISCSLVHVENRPLSKSTVNSSRQPKPQVTCLAFYFLCNIFTSCLQQYFFLTSHQVFWLLLVEEILNTVSCLNHTFPTL